MRLYDAHNHLQDPRFDGRQDALIVAATELGVTRMVVNGTRETDWPAVQSLARRHPCVLASFGCHPWHLHERTPDWQTALVKFLDETPGAILGEIGLDRWKPALDYAGQEEAFCWQFQLAATRNLPATIHCLRAWGRLEELLRAGPRPACGFLLHSYGGPVEMVPSFVALGAYFSFPGYYLHERKTRQRETFRHVPPDRLLIETDAPDQSPPSTTEGFHALADSRSGQPLNHPANLAAIYASVARLLGESTTQLADRLEANFHRLFGGNCPSGPGRPPTKTPG